MQPASATIVLPTGSMERMAFIRSRDRTTDMPVSSGVAAPERPVWPPCGTTGVRVRLAQRISSATSAVSRGRARHKALPWRRPRQSVR